MVSSCHGRVQASSAKPPQRSTTVSPSRVAQNEAPVSDPFSKLASKAVRTAAKRSCVKPALVDMCPLLRKRARKGADVGHEIITTFEGREVSAFLKVGPVCHLHMPLDEAARREGDKIDGEGCDADGL